VVDNNKYYSVAERMFIMDDKWEFYKDKAGEWRWHRTASNGKIVGASTEGYKNKSDCEENARRNGWKG
jgi:uncharacterized protein YegP (UPF0339 family)